MEDDLDILASLADSDFEFQDDDDLSEGISSVSPKFAKSAQHEQTQKQEHDDDDGDKLETAQAQTGQTVEQLAAQIATMQEYIKKLEADRNVLQDSTADHKKLPDSEKESCHSKSTSIQSHKNLDTSKKSLFLKDIKRTAHTPSQSRNQPESSSSSQIPAKGESNQLPLVTRKKSGDLESEKLKVAGSVVPKQKRETAGHHRSSNKNCTEKLLTGKSIVSDNDKFFSEKYSGLRILNPLISSVVMEKRMEGRRMVKMSQIPMKIKGKDDIDGDWVTIGVLVQKLPPKKSSNGKTYGIWKLSDLGANSINEFVALFLFGDVYKEHWKTVEGSVVALLNANLLPAKEKNSKDLALTLDNAKKLMLMGISKDLGKCKGLRKSDNHPCGNYVNRQHGEFCEYHVQTAYKKMRAQRMECQAGYAPSAKAPLMRKFQKDLNNSTFMYQGRTVTASTRPTEHKKKNVTLKSLGTGKKDDSTGNSKDNQDQKSHAEPSEFLVELLALPTIGTRNLVKHLNQDEEQKKPPEERKPSKSASDLLKAHEKEIKEVKNPRSLSAVPLNPFQNGKQDTPMLGRGLDPDSDIFFDESPMMKKRKQNNMDRAKLRALSVVKLKGPIEKEDPNTVRKKVSPKSMEKIEKRVCEESIKENVDENQGQDSRRKRRRILGPEFGSIDLESEEGKKLIAAKSQHVGAVREAEAEREAKYFNELEKKEQMEDKMKTITEIKVRVVFCKQCNYVAESASKLCFKENHVLAHFKTLKKFFVCKNCKQRTVTYGATPIPKHPCRNCGSSNYQKTSLYKEKEGPKIGGETLLVRGEEVPKFLNSLK
ncbi:protein MCM10 homolog [Montipora capricornis]|uniref:protein MCM10 homolog n=1 Tax=Montipora capricornis TaxID=246305 RepID=UPI0035F1F18E